MTSGLASGSIFQQTLMSSTNPDGQLRSSLIFGRSPEITFSRITKAEFSASKEIDTKK